MIKKINVLLDRLVVRPVEPKPRAGILLPAGMKPDYRLIEAVVEQTGAEVKSFVVGDRVVFFRDKSQDLEHQGAHGCEVLREEDVWARLQKASN